MVGLNSFYLFGAVILLVIALVYWADAIREKKREKEVKWGAGGVR